MRGTGVSFCNLAKGNAAPTSSPWRALPSAEERGGYQSNRLITSIQLVSSPAQPLLARAYTILVISLLANPLRSTPLSCVVQIKSRH